MHQQRSKGAIHGHVSNVRSWWSEEDDAFLAEVEGVRGSLIHGDTEEEARTAALELADEWREIEQWLANLSVDEYVTFRRLGAHTAEWLRVEAKHGPERRSLAQWNELTSGLKRHDDPPVG